MQSIAGGGTRTGQASLALSRCPGMRLLAISRASPMSNVARPLLDGRYTDRRTDPPPPASRPTADSRHGSGGGTRPARSRTCYLLAPFIFVADGTERHRPAHAALSPLSRRSNWLHCLSMAFAHDEQSIKRPGRHRRLQRRCCSWPLTLICGANFWTLHYTLGNDDVQFGQF